MRMWLKFGLGLLTAVASMMGSNAWADYVFNMTEGVTPLSRDIYNLHMTAIWVCTGIGLVVFSVLLYTIIFHRKSRGAVPKNFHEHLGVEITWTIIPIIILICLAIPATLVVIRSQNTGDADVNIKITGYQWKWKYDYLDEGVSFYSNLSTPQKQLHNMATKGPNYLLEVDNALVVPIHKKIRFLVTANDVIHSWWVPAFGIKQDGIPGFIHEAWAEIDKPGVYRGQCAELCGSGHGFMPIVVVAMTESDYQAWLKKQTGKRSKPEAVSHKQWTLAELNLRGQSVYETHCAVCHKPDGSGMAPTFPAIKGSKVVKGPIKAQIELVLNGKPGTAMQAFGNQLSDEDMAAVITYQRNAFGNDSGDAVQPSQVKALRH